MATDGRAADGGAGGGRALRRRCTFVALAGGGSRRMGTDKAFVEVGGREMLDRLLEVGRSVCSDCVLVVDEPDRYGEALLRYGWEEGGSPAGAPPGPAAGGRTGAPGRRDGGPGADAPDSGRQEGREFRRGGARLRLVTDRHPGLGPVAGLEAGLAAAGRDLCFAAACDLPFLTSAVVAALLRELDARRARAADPDLCAVVPRAGGRRQPLAAAYARGAGRAAERCVEEGDLRMDDLLERLDVQVVGAEDLAGDGSGEGGRPFVNVNDPGQLRAARRRAGDGEGPT